MVEPPPAPRGAEESVVERAAATSARSVAMFLLILPVAFLGAAASAGSFLAQTDGTNAADRLTLLVAMITLAEGVGSLMAVPMPPIGMRGLLVLGTAGVACSIAVMAYPSGFPAMVLILGFLSGLAEPLRDAAIQRLAADAARARAASLASACDMALMLIAMPLAGLWRSR
jgi:hypothetical protein